MARTEISVCLLTYNSNYNKLIRTLESILCQKSIDFELIISDDGSENFDKKEICSWIDNRGFTNYKILVHKKNIGTVKNMLSALKEAVGIYVKTISPGDYLYNNTSLYRMMNFMKENNLTLCFGDAVPYDSNGLLPEGYLTPHSIVPYLMHDDKRMRNNYIRGLDYACGAGYMIERESFFSTLDKLSEKIVYAEDCAFVYLIASGARYDWWPHKIIYYEYGSGISTNGDSTWLSLIHEDNRWTFWYISQEFPEWRDMYNKFVKTFDL